MGRWHARPDGRALAGTHQAGHRLEPDVRVPGLGADLVDIAGGPKGDGLKKEIEAGKYPGIVKTTLDGSDQRDYLEGKSDKSAREVLFYYTGPKPSAVRYKNWKMYYTMVPDPLGAMKGPTSYHWTMVDNIKRDPFEIAGGLDDGNPRVNRRRTRLAEQRLRLRLEHAASRPAAVDERAHVVQGVSAAASPGDLQPRRHHCRNARAA